MRVTPVKLDPKVAILQSKMREQVYDLLGDIAETLSEKGYDYNQFAAFTCIEVGGNTGLMARVNFPGGEIAFALVKEPKAKPHTGGRVRKAQEGVLDHLDPASYKENVEILKHTLYWKTILAELRKKADEMPYYFNLNAAEITELQKPHKLNETAQQAIENRTILDRISLSPEDVNTIAGLLEQLDFTDSGIHADYAMELMERYLDQRQGSPVGPRM